MFCNTFLWPLRLSEGVGQVLHTPILIGEAKSQCWERFGVFSWKKTQLWKTSVVKKKTAHKVGFFQYITWYNVRVCSSGYRQMNYMKQKWKWFRQIKQAIKKFGRDGIFFQGSKKHCGSVGRGWRGKDCESMERVKIWLKRLNCIQTISTFTSFLKFKCTDFKQSEH